MLDFFNGLIEFLSNSFLLVFNLIVWILNLVIWFITNLFNLVVSIFPNSPFSLLNYDFGIGEFIGYLNWFLPIDILISITLSWCGCMILYWGGSVLLRYLKIID